MDGEEPASTGRGRRLERRFASRQHDRGRRGAWFVLETTGSPAKTGLALGALVAAYGVGALCGTMLYGLLAVRTPRRRAYVAGRLVCAAAFVLLVPLAPLALVLAALVLVGAGLGVVDPIQQTVRLERTPATLRGRVVATTQAGIMATASLGILLAGVLVELAGLRPTLALLAGGIALVAVASVIVVAPRLEPTRDRLLRPEPVR